LGAVSSRTFNESSFDCSCAFTGDKETVKNKNKADMNLIISIFKVFAENIFDKDKPTWRLVQVLKLILVSGQEIVRYLINNNRFVSSKDFYLCRSK
jgi:hypothetical protein